MPFLFIYRTFFCFDCFLSRSMEFSHHFAWSSKYRIEKGILGRRQCTLRHMKLSKTQADFRIWHNFIDFFLLPFHISAAKLAFLPTAIRMMADSVLPIQFGCLALREIKCGKCWAKNKRIFLVSGNSYRTHCYWLIKWIWIWFMGIRAEQLKTETVEREWF